MLGKVGPILDHLVSTPDMSLFSDEIVARVRGMIGDLARQILRAQAEATGQAAREDFANSFGEDLAAALQRSEGLVAYCHAIALEWQLTMRLEATDGIDPVLSPFLQESIGSRDSAMAGTAMAALASQARFAQAQRRMELPLAELPADIFHLTLNSWRTVFGDSRSDAMVRAEAKLRNGFDESASREGLLARLLSLASDDPDALKIEIAGVAVFFTALASRLNQSRRLSVLSSNKGQLARLSVSLRAAGLTPDQIKAIILRLHPDVPPSIGIECLSADEARRLLSESMTAQLQ